MNNDIIIAEWMAHDKKQEMHNGKSATYYLLPMVPKNEDDLEWHNANFLKFTSSYDWLMTVVRKIEENAPTRVIIDCNECRIVADRRFKVHTMKKINSITQCVVQYIEWAKKQQ